VLGKLSGHGGPERGQPVGSEMMHVVARLGPHETEGAADEKGFKSILTVAARLWEAAVPAITTAIASDSDRRLATSVLLGGPRREIPR
jgi:hypothetical protein